MLLETDHFRADLLDRVFLIRWFGEVRNSDIALLLQELPKARERAGQKLFYISTTDPEVPAPTPAVRATIQREINQLFAPLEAMYLVIPGTSISVSLMRTMMRAMSVAMRVKQPVYIEESIGGALRAIGPKLSSPVHHFEQWARTNKLTSPGD